MIAKDIAELMVVIQRDEAKATDLYNKEGPAVKGQFSNHVPPRPGPFPSSLSV